MAGGPERSEEHTSELQSLRHIVCRLLLEKKKNNTAGFQSFSTEIGWIYQQSVLRTTFIESYAVRSAIPNNLFFFNDTATTEIYTLSLHDALPILRTACFKSIISGAGLDGKIAGAGQARSEEHTSELQSLRHLVCRLLLEKKK